MDIGKIEHMRKEDSIKAGLFIVVTVALLALVIFVMGSDKQIFSDQEEYLTVFSDIKGLSEGAPVRLSGISVGRVAKISFSNDTFDTRVHVKFLVNKKYLERIFVDSVISIETQGLLGDRFLSISPGTEKKPAPPGAIINSSEPSDIAQVLSKAGVIVDNTVEVSKNFNDFVKVLRNDTLDHMTQAAANIASITHEIEKGEGLFHRLLYNKKDGESIAKGFADASKGIGDLVTEIKTGNGILHSLIYDDGGSSTVVAIADASKEVAKLATSLTEISDEIKGGKGLANQLIYGNSPEGLNDIVANLNQTAENLRKASEAVTQGSGTLGSLLVDSQLYDNLVEVTEGAKRSFILRQAIRSSLEK